MKRGGRDSDISLDLGGENFWGDGEGRVLGVERVKKPWCCLQAAVGKNIRVSKRWRLRISFFSSRRILLTAIDTFMTSWSFQGHACVQLYLHLHSSPDSSRTQKWSLVSFNFYISTDNSFNYVFANTIATSGRYWVPQCLIKYKLSALIKQYVFFFYMSAVTYQAIKAWEMHVIIYPICNCPTYITWPKPLYMMFLYECCTNKLFFFVNKILIIWIYYQCDL